MIYDGKRTDGGEYMEDSTRGNAILNPKTVKADLMVQVWMPRTEVAALTVWLADNGENPRFMSEVIRKTVHMVYDNLVSNEEIRPLDDPVLASDILASRFGVNVEVKKKGGRNLLHNKILYDRKVASGLAIDSDDTMRGITEAIAKMKKIDEEERLAKIAIDRETYLLQSANSSNRSHEHNINKSAVTSEMVEKWNRADQTNSSTIKVDKNDQYTMKKMTAEDIRAKELELAERDRINDELIKQENARMREIKNECH